MAKIVRIRHVRGPVTPNVIARAAAANWTQDGRLIALETPLGKDKLLLTSLAGEETISRLFAYELEMLSADHAISPESLIGRNVKVVITSEDGKTRPIHGMVAQFRAGPLAGRELRQYSAHVVPWLWYLGHSTDCRIFQNLNVPDIIDQVFKTFGFTDYQTVGRARRLPQARVLRAVPGNRAELRLAPDGGGGHLLLLPT